MENGVCFTGHRVIPASEYERIQAVLYAKIRSAAESGYDIFNCGGAIGFDTLAALTVIDLKHFFKNIKLSLILPCKNQSEKWSTHDRDIYKSIIKNADRIVYISDVYNSGCMYKRNRALVDASKYCIAYKTREHGGTAYTVNYAYNCGLDVDIIR